MIFSISPRSCQFFFYCFFNISFLHLNTNMVLEARADSCATSIVTSRGAPLTTGLLTTGICSKTCLVGLLIRSIFRENNCTSASARMHFSEPQIERINRPHDMFCFNHAYNFYPSNNIEKMLINNKFEAHTLTGNPTGNSRCHALASRALNMSCSFGQSARLI